MLLRSLGMLRNWRPAVLRDPTRLVGPALLFASLALVRVQLVEDIGLTAAQLLEAGLANGLMQDLFAMLVPLVVSALAWGLAGVRRGAWIATALFVWSATVANALHFRFFGIPLDWWIVAMHWSDLLMVSGSAADLGLTWPVAASLALLVASLLAALLQPRLATRLGSELEAPADGAARRRAAALLLAGSLAGAFIFWRLPGWLDVQGGLRPLNDHIVRTWLEQNFKSSMYAGVGADFLEQAGVDAALAGSPGAALVEFRDHGRPPGPPPVDAAWPLYRSFEEAPAATRELRERLGLAADRPPNIFLLFLESVRAFELLDSELGPLVFPRLRRVLEEHGVLFRQAYSSAFTAGQTVRGQFSTLCSMLPNDLGAATYIAHTTMRVSCIQQFLREQGYRTAWMNSYRASFHKKQSFEMLHGTELFFDEQEYLRRGITHRIGDWGLADAPFLQASLDIFADLAAAGAPVFANVLTISTHHPYSIVPEGPLPEALARATAQDGYYQGYLSRLVYIDGALGDFFEAFFAHPIAESSVIVLLGDHGSPVLPPRELTQAQRSEALFRIPLAVIGKHTAPASVDWPVHQIDVAPTIARLSGGTDLVTWIGHDIFNGPGGPWMYVAGEALSYRTAERGCYTPTGAERMRCYDVSGQDPLFARELVELPADPASEEIMWRAARATLVANALNRLAPPTKSAALAR